MYDNVIVPFDGGLESRAALAPAADLAWRCNAKVVVVNTTPALDDQSRLALKTQAISMSGADVDFWVDIDHGIGDALVAAATHRSDSIICVASRHRTTGVVRRREIVIPPPWEVFTSSRVPVLAIGPHADVSRGLPMAELMVAHDGSATAERAVDLAVDWARQMKLAVRLVGVVAASGRSIGATPLAAQLERRLGEIAPQVPEASLEIIESDRPGEALAALLDDRPDAVGVLTTHGGLPNGEPLGPVARELLERSTRALLFARPHA